MVVIRGPTVLLAVLLSYVNGITAGVHIEGTTAISKTRTSSTMRMIFVAGLEGTGHHYIMGALRHMYKKSEDVVHMEECGMATRYLVPRLMSESSTHYAKTLELARKDMRRLALQGNTLQWPGGVVTLQGTPPKEVETCQQVGMLSYPNFAGENKVFQYFDLGMLAEVAEAEGVDLRVVFLHRSVEDTIISNTQHRRFQNRLGAIHKSTKKGRYMEYMRIMFTEIGVMHSMLAELGPDFVTCHNSSDTGNALQASQVANFVAPTQHIADLFRGSLVETAVVSGGSITEHVKMKDARVVTRRLQRKMDTMVSSFC